MENLLKILGGGVIIWLVFGGKGVLDRDHDAPRSSPAIPADSVSLSHGPPERIAETPPELKPPNQVPLAMRSRLPFEIHSLAFLKSLDARPLTLENVQVTYYLRENSTRCHFDSLPPCLQDHLDERELNARDFQYTYFFDRVLDSGSGVLTWEMREYLVQYEALRRFFWTSGKRNFTNDYQCKSFSYRSKKGVEFIQDNLMNRELFRPLERSRFPNGQTASGEAAIDWQTLAVNLADFPLSVPDAKRRESWTKRAGANGTRPPRARVFVVLEFPNGRKYLTEASDTGSGLKSRTVDWRIGNTSEEIAFFLTLGNKAKATAFMLDDSKITFAEVLARSQQAQ
ncbi:MAG: hypothetical protein AAB354_04850 [candidate division KSB1 bacterium]